MVLYRDIYAMRYALCAMRFPNSSGIVTLTFILRLFNERRYSYARI
jgi:hypothetical protein